MSTIRIRRANVVLDIRPEDKDRYMEQGFSVIDTKGNVLEEAMPKDVLELQRMVTELRTEIEKKDKEIESLKKKKAAEKKADSVAKEAK